jgi:UDP-glucose 4-epimerase
MRVTGSRCILYASGSGVYGELQDREVDENHTPLEPVSTYGASKLAGESLISAYAHMFGISGRSFRFANVVGPRQTHGVAFDFIRKLSAEPHRLPILGDGTQFKSYIDVRDVVAAVLLALEKETRRYQVYNVATHDCVTVSQIARLVVSCLELTNVTFEYSGGNRGWNGDVPIVRLNSDRIRALGWQHRMSSADALRGAVMAMLGEARPALGFTERATAAYV